MQTRESMHFTALQRQVAQTLTQNYLRDRQPAIQRQQEYAQHVVTLQRHPLSGVVGQAFMRGIPAVERPTLQRAVDEIVQREALQRQQDEQALQYHSLQRQLAELNAESTQPVFERIQARRGSGNPLPEAVQRHLEQGLNHDLSSVRIHDDAEADKMAKGVNAIAFTTGTDIFFQSGKFNPNTQTGMELLAHEVTHTVQQSKGQVGKGIDQDSGLESEARTMGRKLASKQFKRGPLKAKSLQKLAPLTARASVQRLQAKPQMSWSEFQAILKSKLVQRLNQNANQLKTETFKYQKTGATPQWRHLLQLTQKDRQAQQKQQTLLKSIQQRYPRGIAGLPFPAKPRGQAASPDPAFWITYLQTAAGQLGSQAGPYVEAMRQLAASEGLRAAAHKAFPGISALSTTSTPLKVEKSPQLLGEMKGQFAKTTDAIEKLKGEIQGGKIPWKYTDLVVQDIFKEYGVKSDAPAMKAYQQALKSDQTSQIITMLLTAGVSVAAVFATGPASLALGAVAAASGVGQAYLETHNIRKQLDVAEASRFGQNLTSVKVDAAQFQLAVGYLDTALSVIDVAAIGKVLAVASGTALVARNAQGGSAAVRRGMEQLEGMLTEQGLMPRQPELLGAGNTSGKVPATSRPDISSGNTDAMAAARRRVGGSGSAPDPKAEEVTKQLGKLPSNWTDLRSIIDEPFDPSKLPGPYTLSGKGRNMTINLPSGTKGLAPLMVDDEGILRIRTQQRLSVRSTMRKNYIAAYQKIPDNHWIHHLIPDNLVRNHPLGKLLQKIGFEIDDALNLLALPDKDELAKILKKNPKAVGHWTSHDNYDRMVTAAMTNIYEKWRGKGIDLNKLTPEQIKELKDEVLELQKTLRQGIENGDDSLIPIDPAIRRITMNQTSTGAA